MKILLLSSSPHKEKSQTYLLAKEVLRGCGKTGIESEIIHLCDLKIEFCHHCEACHKKILSCPIRDDVRSILKKMLEAEGIILATPNYINQVTASMKAFFDRSSHFIHCKRLLGKYIAGVVSSGSGQDKMPRKRRTLLTRFSERPRKTRQSFDFFMMKNLSTLRFTPLTRNPI